MSKLTLNLLTGLLFRACDDLRDQILKQPNLALLETKIGDPNRANPMHAAYEQLLRYCNGRTEAIHQGSVVRQGTNLQSNQESSADGSHHHRARWQCVCSRSRVGR
jgi:hypothetical protein